ncbi:hypothetical protein MHPYR_320085 [uncultured Mycobacterium sp.]|uniref:Uncharacterized protein n=1 Tax=uncultured Mycobacterium sp. TaxID=171292 RepID=A0A1Y5PCT9_9MYCO|nr:hypothetical protein MHPYR_320085 [uncultured Mycobacterium sp.]
MTENYADQPNAADARRASAITIHHRRGNRDGIKAILDAVGDDIPVQIGVEDGLDGRVVLGLARHGAPIKAILDETGEANRVTELFLAILGIHSNALLELRSETGLKYIEGFVKEIGELAEATDPQTLGGDVNRVSRLLDAHARHDIPELNRALRDAFAHRRTVELTIGLLDIFELVLPELTSTAGIRWLEVCITQFGTEENG